MTFNLDPHRLSLVVQVVEIVHISLSPDHRVPMHCAASAMPFPHNTAAPPLSRLTTRGQRVQLCKTLLHQRFRRLAKLEILEFRTRHGLPSLFLHLVQHRLEQYPRIRLELCTVKQTQPAQEQRNIAFPRETAERLEVDFGQEVAVACFLVGY